ncbi:hypothetical protein A6J51_13005 [Neisseria meningitidis]|nr:hypothetical protein A6J51_13005 [Neisseria meningitidis]
MTGSACFLQPIFCLDDMARQPVSFRLKIHLIKQTQ